MKYLILSLLLMSIIGCDSYYNSQTKNYSCTQDQLNNIKALTEYCMKSGSLMSYPNCYNQAVINFCTIKPH